jgi:hypothetical protein
VRRWRTAITQEGQVVPRLISVGVKRHNSVLRSSTDDSHSHRVSAEARRPLGDAASCSIPPMLLATAG